MSAYLLSCQCGKSIPVDVGQAGERVVCECGTQLEVPTLRKLRHLPRADSNEPVNPPAWDVNRGVAAAGVIFAAILAGVGLWSHFTEPTVPQFDPEYRTGAVDQGLEKMTPLDSWNLWVEVYQPLSKKGFAVFEHPERAAIERAIAHRRLLQTILSIIAAICVTVALAAELWRRKSIRKPS